MDKNTLLNFGHVNVTDRKRVEGAPWGNHLWHCMHKCYVLSAVFAFAFTPSPLRLVTDVISND